MSSTYCTIFDSGYLARALILYSSLMRWNANAQMGFYCMDDQAAELLEKLGLPRAIVVRHSELATPELERVRPLRSRGEYCWTCKPFAVRHMAQRVPPADWVIYVDADMMFFDDPDKALPGIESHYQLTPHRYSPRFSEYAATAGLHNAGYLAARNTAEGMAVIDWWGERCIESCDTQVTGETFADQKYLDRFAELFPYGEGSAPPGLNAAPWNIENYRVLARDGKVFLDSTPLALYHFQGLRFLGRSSVDLYPGNLRLTVAVRDAIYIPYLDALRDAYGLIESVAPGLLPGLPKNPFGILDWMRLATRMLRGYHNPVQFRLK